ncbi:hypothetical protein SLA2020_399120 [Shorea laevis]
MADLLVDLVQMSQKLIILCSSVGRVVTSHVLVNKSRRDQRRSRLDERQTWIPSLAQSCPDQQGIRPNEAKRSCGPRFATWRSDILDTELVCAD